MPQVVYDSIRGLIQQAGTGLLTNEGPVRINSYTLHDDVTATLDKVTFFHISDPQEGTVTLTLPANPPVGIIKIIMVIDASNNTVIKGTNTTLGGDLTLNASGDGAICFGLGSDGWGILRSNG